MFLGILPTYLKDYLIPCDNLRTYLTQSLTQKASKTFPGRIENFKSFFFQQCAEILA